MNKVEIYDTTLRDGEQAPGAAMQPESKLEIAVALQQLGVDTIEAGFPAASTDDAKAVSEISKVIRGVRIAAFARAKSEDIIVAGASIKDAEYPRITIVMPVSDLHIQTKLRLGHDKASAMLESAIKEARNYCAEVEVIAEDATRADLNFLSDITQTSISAGASVFTIADTVGYTTPDDLKIIFNTLEKEVPSIEDILLGIHCHDDLGLATINTLSALGLGAQQAHCTINGLGERAGNAALEEVIMAIKIRNDRFPYSNNINVKKLWPTSRLVSEISKFSVSPNKAIIGKNAYAHGAGIHQDGMLKDSKMYQIISPELVGAPLSHMPITRHSGRKGLSARLIELGITLPENQLEPFFVMVKDCFMHTPILGDVELIKLVDDFKCSVSAKLLEE